MVIFNIKERGSENQVLGKATYFVENELKRETQWPSTEGCIKCKKLYIATESFIAQRQKRS